MRQPSNNADAKTTTQAPSWIQSSYQEPREICALGSPIDLLPRRFGHMRQNSKERYWPAQAGAKALPGVTVSLHCPTYIFALGDVETRGEWLPVPAHSNVKPLLGAIAQTRQLLLAGVSRAIGGVPEAAAHGK